MAPSAVAPNANGLWVDMQRTGIGPQKSNCTFGVDDLGWPRLVGPQAIVHTRDKKPLLIQRISDLMDDESSAVLVTLNPGTTV
jgi:hypothetical protein